MRFNSLVSTAVLLSHILPAAGWAQASGTPGLALCDAYLDMRSDENDNGDDEDTSVQRRALYDQEVREILTTEAAIMDAIYEEKWDLATGEPVERTALCQGVPTYVVNWAEFVGPGQDGTATVLAKGFFSLRKDGTFQFDYNKRPYAGSWALNGTDITLTAGWLNDGAPLASPVERVETPIELTYSDGRTDTYTEQVYRIGPFRLLPIDTTAKGVVLNCACPTE